VSEITFCEFIAKLLHENGMFQEKNLTFCFDSNLKGQFSFKTLMIKNIGKMLEIFFLFKLVNDFALRLGGFSRFAYLNYLASRLQKFFVSSSLSIIKNSRPFSSVQLQIKSPNSPRSQNLSNPLKKFFQELICFFFEKIDD